MPEKRQRLTIPTLPRAEKSDDQMTTPPTEQPKMAPPLTLANDAVADAPTPLRSDSRGKRIMNRTPWLDLPDPFDNLRIRVWLDYPRDVAELWTSQEGETAEEASERMLDACRSTFLEHDGWEDGREDEMNPETGEEYGALPQPTTTEFWARIPTPLAKALIVRFGEELNPSEDAPKGNISRVSRSPKRRG